MRLICALAGHKPGTQKLRNRSVEFARCSRCGCDLVRKRRSRWKQPKGYRVRWPANLPEWKRGGAADTVATPPPPAAAAREPIARISLYTPDPNERDFMEDDGEDMFWNVPIAAVMVHRAPDEQPARKKKRRWA